MCNRIKRVLAVMIEENAGKNQPPCDAGLVLSIPGIGPAVAAALLTEASKPIRERDYEALRCYGRHGSCYQAKRQEKNCRHASGLRSALAKRGVLLGDKQPLLR